MNKNEELMLLDVNVGEENNYIELIIVKKGTLHLTILNAIRDYLDTEEGKERSMDDEITEYLIDRGFAINVMSYTYVYVS